MKIITANKYHFLNGGAERYMLSLTEELRNQGHEVIPFGIRYDRNIPTDYDEYFIAPAGSGDQIRLNRQEGGALTRLRIAARAVYSLEAKSLMNRLVSDTNPDLLYCLNIVNHMSPSIIDSAAKHGVPVVMRLSDYNLVCPSYLCLREGSVCTECYAGYHRALKYKCIYGSMSATACRVIAMYAHKWLGLYDKVGAFVTPAKTLRHALIKCGFPEEKVHYIPTFVNISNWNPCYENHGYILYFGRLTPEKGINVLIDAYCASGVSDPLVVVGDGNPDYVAGLKLKVPENMRERIHFVGEKSGEELRDVVRYAKYVVVPSVCFDNSPNVVYESFAAGKPVVGSAIGGIQEQVNSNVGMLVKPGDVTELAQALQSLSADTERLELLGRNARRLVEEEHNVKTHIERLLRLFGEVCSAGGQ